MTAAPAVDYSDFLRAKIAVSKSLGFETADSEIHPLLKPHQRVGVRWAVRGGRRALFEGLFDAIEESADAERASA